MPEPLVLDTGPIIALARADALDVAARRTTGGGAKAALKAAGATASTTA